ncbi:unnamed protein product [Caenorhabditis sp. 36 PRJEB53466]|nr:unnamed protein product [Caenorhabditis sp. 36 PRJEB53466]
MITMSNRKQEYSCHSDEIYHDSYNLQPGYEEPPGDHYSSGDQGPYVLATLRNVFSEAPNEEYELVYDVDDRTSSEVRMEQQSPPYLPVPRQEEQEEEEDHEEEEDDFDIDDEQAKLFHCTECNKTYTSERRLKHHLVVHKNKEAYKCPTCGYCYQSPDSLKRHMKKAAECNPDLQKTAPEPRTEQ